MRECEVEEFAKSILFVVVCYRQSFRDAPAVKALDAYAEAAGVRCDLVVFDNSPEYNTNRDDTPSLSVRYHPNERNWGVSACYNKAAEIVSRFYDRKQWLFLLDQDTDLPEKFLDFYHQAFLNYPNEKLFCPRVSMGELGVAAPFYSRFFHNAGPYQGAPGKVSVDSLCSINSGLLIHRDVFRQTGGYNPQIPLDFSDYYFFHLYRQAYPAFVVVDVILPHALSSLSKLSRESALARFVYYIHGARKMAPLDRFRAVMIVAFLRAIKMSWRYKSLKFLSCFFSLKVDDNFK